MIHTFVAYVENEPGVLNRVASLFRRRNYNIESLAVGPTHQADVSRMCFQVEAVDDSAARRIEANLYKLVNVLYVEDVTHKDAVLREMLLVKIKADRQTRGEIVQIGNIFQADIVDTDIDSLGLVITGQSSKIDRVIRMLQPFGIIELQRTGVVAMVRGGIGLPVELTQPVDLNGEYLS
jgi:acetolactate synthase-1/3 small subunit